jgi:tight adherence protein B
MVAVAPFAIVLGAMAAVGLLFYSFWDRLLQPLANVTTMFAVDLERAAIRIQSEQIVLSIVGLGVAIWAILVALLRPGFILAAILLPTVVVLAGFGFRTYVRGRAAKRARQFHEQLELVLRMIGSGLRVGLGLRQALVLVTEEVADPARVEFARAIGETNIGTSLDDALAGLLRRMPSDELRMMVDAIRIANQTGGNLAKVLDHLAATIKGRRQIQRKVRALTGEARAGAWVIGFLPVFVGGFVMLTEPAMRSAMIETTVGHIGALLALLFEVGAILSLRQLLRFEI